MTHERSVRGAPGPRRAGASTPRQMHPAARNAEAVPHVARAVGEAALDASTLLALQKAVGNVVASRLVAQGGGPVPPRGPEVQRAVTIGFDKTVRQPTSAHAISTVKITRERWAVGLENLPAQSTQRAHTTATVVFRTMIKRLLEGKTWGEAWRGLNKEYEFLQRLWEAWKTYPALEQQPLGDPKTLKDLEHELNHNAGKCAAAAEKWKGSQEQNLGEPDIRELQALAELWLAARAMLPYTSLDEEQSQRNEDLADGEVLAGIEKEKISRLTEGIFRTFDFRVSRMRPSVTLDHALAAAARHVVEHLEYYPAIDETFKRQKVFQRFFEHWWAEGLRPLALRLEPLPTDSSGASSSGASSSGEPAGMETGEAERQGDLSLGEWVRLFTNVEKRFLAACHHFEKAVRR